MVVVQFVPDLQCQFIVLPDGLTAGAGLNPAWRPDVAHLLQLFQLHGQQGLLHLVRGVRAAVQNFKHSLKPRLLLACGGLVAAPSQLGNIGVVQLHGSRGHFRRVREPREQAVGQRQCLFEGLPVLLGEPPGRVQFPAHQVHERQGELHAVRVLFRQGFEQSGRTRRDVPDPGRGKPGLRFQQQRILVKIVRVVPALLQQTAEQFERIVVFAQRLMGPDRFDGTRIFLDDLPGRQIGLNSLSLLSKGGGELVHRAAVGAEFARAPESVLRQRIVARPHGRRSDEQIHVRDLGLRQITLFGDLLVVRHQTG